MTFSHMNLFLLSSFPNREPLHQPLVRISCVPYAHESRKSCASVIIPLKACLYTSNAQLT